MRRTKVLALALSTAMVLSLVPATAMAAGTAVTGPDATSKTDNAYDIYLDYSEGIEAGAYKWFPSEDGSYYRLQRADEDGNAIGDPSAKTAPGVPTSAVVTNDIYQSMIVYAPAEYFNLDDDGNVIGINYETEVNGYTAATAPIIFENNNGAWKSGSPKGCDTDYIEAGMIHVMCGSRSRDALENNGAGELATGKSPTQVVDLKAGVIQLRTNTDVIPGNTDRIISVGGSGAGQMSSILGASGNMDEYYSYMYATGVVGVEKSGDSYTSKYDDSVYGAMCYCPIADLENADMAYSWWRFDSTVDENGEFTATSAGKVKTPFAVALQNDLAQVYVNYINNVLPVTNEDGEVLTLTSPREGSYYDQILQNVSDALNLFVENTEWPYDKTVGKGDNAVTYTCNNMDELIALYETLSGVDSDTWVEKNSDGTYSVTDMAAFLEGTQLSRNKAVPDFSNLDLSGKSGENNAFGPATIGTAGVAFSDSVVDVLVAKDYTGYEGYDAATVAAYIASFNENIEYQANLMNATEILLGTNGLESVDPAEHWRTRNGTADQHTSFTIAYNLAMAANANASVETVDYSLVWEMGHGAAEGTTTGTFIDWVEEICAYTSTDDGNQNAGDNTQTPSGDTQKPADTTGTNNGTTTNTTTKAPQTGEASYAALLAVVVAFGAVAVVGTRKRELH